jgi:hypothetical protein
MTEAFSNEKIAEKQILLEKMKQKIEGMSKPHHIEILKILKENSSIKLNANKSGIYVNISYLDDETIEKINKYLHYIEDQESTLLTVEYQKEDFINEYFQMK